MNILQPIAIIVGVLSGMSGLVLGIANWWHQRVTTRPRVVVRLSVRCIIDEKDGETVATYAAVFEICNVGHVPVIGWTVGFLPAWTAVRLLPRRMRNGKLVQFLKLRRSAYAFTIEKQEPIHKGLEWRREVRPQHIALLRFEPLEVQQGLKIGRAFVETVVGDRFKASRRDMRKFIKQCKELRQEESTDPDGATPPDPATPCSFAQRSRTPVED